MAKEVTVAVADSKVGAPFLVLGIAIYAIHRSLPD